MSVQVRAGVRRVVASARTLVYRVLDTIPPVRRTVDELLRVEFVDRSVVIAAQGLLALLPLLVVLAAFLPGDLTATSLDELKAVTGVDQASADLLGRQVAGSGPVIDISEVRAQTGAIGLVLTVLSASSFARAVQRMYERVWQQDHLGGLRGRRRCLGWLLGWLLALQVLSLVGLLADRVELGDMGVLWIALQCLLASVLWWWSLDVLLTHRVPPRQLVVPAAITGVAVVVYSAGSSLVMPRYAVTSVEQFGTLGLVLAVASWLVGLAGVMVVSAVVGRVLTEDRYTRSLLLRLRTALSRR